MRPAPSRPPTPGWVTLCSQGNNHSFIMWRTVNRHPGQRPLGPRGRLPHVGAPATTVSMKVYGVHNTNSDIGAADDPG